MIHNGKGSCAEAPRSNEAKLSVRLPTCATCEIHRHKRKFGGRSKRAAAVVTAAHKMSLDSLKPERARTPNRSHEHIQISALH